MPRQIVTGQKAWLLASLLAGISFFFVKDWDLSLPEKMAWKGAGVAFLAVWASLSASRDARQIGVVMAFGALGDVLIEKNLVAGALAFLAGHIVAIHLYLRHHRSVFSPSQKLAVWALFLFTPIIAFLLPADRSSAPGIAFYAFGLGAMAAGAWASSFPRYRVGIGAVLFVASDLLIFSRLGPLSNSALPGLLIWPLYYFGQYLICTGVVGTVEERNQGLASEG